MEFLPVTVVVLALVVLIGFFNEKTLKLTNEIALMLYSSIIGILLAVIAYFAHNSTVQLVLNDIQVFNLEKFLLDGVLCFMLFAGCCHMKIGDFKKHARPVGVLSFLCTLLGAVIYGLLFYGAAVLLKLPFNLPMCLMFGSIVAPTDPIAATSILKEFGFPQASGFLMEAESLLNDGVGVALFVCFSGMVKASGINGGGIGEFFLVMLREIVGAVVIGGVITLLCFLLFKHTEDGKRRIFISLLAVGLSYLLCEVFNCSGAIASVVCGVMFSALRDREEKKGNPMDLSEFDSQWDVLDVLLNSALYVILGLTFVRIRQTPHVLIIAFLAIACNFAGRIGSLFAGTFCMGPIPDGYSRGEFIKLFTWGGLRGGLCVALAMSTEPMLSQDVFHYILGGTYAIVFFTTVIQGLTMRKVCAKQLK